MLYLSTRSKADVFTAHRALTSDHTIDGGLYTPYQIPVYSKQDLLNMQGKPFCQVVAEILNKFFSSNLTAWDVEISIGRTPVRIERLSNKVLIAECFHNPMEAYEYIEHHLYERLAGSEHIDKPTIWARIAFRIALIFGAFSSVNDCLDSFDISINSTDTVFLMAAWYAKAMGLPIHRILCCSLDDSALWDLIQRGEVNTGAHSKEFVELVEQILYVTYDDNCVGDFANACATQKAYQIPLDKFDSVQIDFLAYVVGQERIVNIISNVNNTNRYKLSQSGAICYGGLQDHRAVSGQNRRTLIFIDQRS